MLGATVDPYVPYWILALRSRFGGKHGSADDWDKEGGGHNAETRLLHDDAARVALCASLNDTRCFRLLAAALTELQLNLISAM